MKIFITTQRIQGLSNRNLLELQMLTSILLQPMPLATIYTTYSEENFNLLGLKFDIFTNYKPNKQKKTNQLKQHRNKKPAAFSQLPPQQSWLLLQNCKAPSLKNNPARPTNQQQHEYRDSKQIWSPKNQSQPATGQFSRKQKTSQTRIIREIPQLEYRATFSILPLNFPLLSMQVITSQEIFCRSFSSEHKLLPNFTSFLNLQRLYTVDPQASLQTVAIKSS